SERADRPFPKIGRKCRRIAGPLSAPIRTSAYGQDRRRRSRSVSLSWARIQLVRRLRVEPAWNEKYSAPPPRPQLAGGGEAQGDLDLDGRTAARPRKSAGLQRARQRPRDARDEARSNHHSRQL